MMMMIIIILWKFVSLKLSVLTFTVFQYGDDVTVYCVAKLEAAYVKCIKMFFGFDKGHNS